MDLDGELLELKCVERVIEKQFFNFGNESEIRVRTAVRGIMQFSSFVFCCQTVFTAAHSNWCFEFVVERSGCCGGELGVEGL